MNRSSEDPTPPPRRLARRSVVTAALVAGVAVAVTPSMTAAQAPEPPAPTAPPTTQPVVTPPPLATVFQQIVQGDLVVAGSSTTPGPDAARSADVDGDVGTLCIGRTTRSGAVCDDNSSSAHLDLPDGASVIAARLYVTTTLSSSVGPLSVRLAGPDDGGAYSELGVDSPVARRVDELARGAHRQATWDVTDFVRQRGGGDYTVADIVSERIGPSEYSAWTIVAAYELAGGVDVAELPAEQQVRFASRAISWHDGLATTAEGPVEVEVGGFTVPMDQPVFGTSAHVLTPVGGTAFDNVLFAGSPLGNNATPGDAAPPTGVVVGTHPACNSTVDVVNGSTCALGWPAGVPRPDPAVQPPPPPPPVAPAVVDMDVLRIPDRYLVPGATTAMISVEGDANVAVGVLAVSIDQPAGGGS
jgi:hypothetical protein